jgi:hypothetical protein
LSDLFTDPGVRRIASFPSRLFFRKGFVLPRLGVAHSLIGIAELEPALSGVLEPALSGVPDAAQWRLFQDRHH